jgi:hypothetical protein
LVWFRFGNKWLGLDTFPSSFELELFSNIYALGFALIAFFS